MSFYSTRQVAKMLRVTPASISKAIWDNRIEPPAKGPSGNYLWKIEDVERASWVIRRRDASDIFPAKEVVCKTAS